jgi:hypothetical protein
MQDDEQTPCRPKERQTACWVGRSGWKRLRTMYSGYARRAIPSGRNRRSAPGLGVDVDRSTSTTNASSYEGGSENGSRGTR